MAYSPNSKQIHMAVADDEFSCPLCCEVFEDPKLLPNCAHSYCKSCLHELVLRNNSNRVSCPVCRKVSNVPLNGIDGFATHTLLVRLIDNIPGRKDKEMVSKALAQCKDEIEKNKTTQAELEKKLSKVNQNREKGLMLKKEISEHAQNAIDSIRQWEQNLCSEVDAHLKENCGLEFSAKLEERKQKLQNQIEEAGACVKNVEEMLNRNEMGEILEMKKVVLEQLREYSSLPSYLSMKDTKTIQDFEMEFQKHEVKQDLGEVLQPSQKTLPARTESCGFASAVPCLPSHLGASSYLRSESSTSSYKDTLAVWQSRQKLLEVPLKFEPYRLAVCVRTGDIALLWEEKMQVHLYSSDGRHKNTITIKYGDLFDVGFTIDDEIVVVNRQHNRLLLYEKDGQFINFEVEIPRDCLKYTYVSIDSEGRLIVTSTRNDDEEDENIIPCIIVYKNGCSDSFKMFGRRSLVRPVSRAIYQNGKFYIADECDSEFVVRCFNFQGKHCLNITMEGNDDWYYSISSVECNGKVFVMRTCLNETLVTIIQGDEVVEFIKKQHNCSNVTEAVVIHDSPGSITQVEIYEDLNKFAIVKYF